MTCQLVVTPGLLPQLLACSLASTPSRLGVACLPSVLGACQTTLPLRCSCCLLVVPVQADLKAVCSRDAAINAQLQQEAARLMVLPA